MRGLIVGAAFIIACGTSHARGWRPGKPEHDNRMRRREVAPAMRVTNRKAPAIAG